MRCNRVILAGALLAMAAPLSAPLAAQDSAPSTQRDAAVAIADGADTVLPVGMNIAMLTTQSVSSKNARKGDLVTLTLAEDIVRDGVVVLPAGTLGTGEITAAEKKGMMGQGGKLSLKMLYLTLADGRTVRLSGDLVSVGSDATTLATAVTTATMGMVPFITGKTATIPEGTILTVRLDREVRLRDTAN